MYLKRFYGLFLLQLVVVVVVAGVWVSCVFRVFILTWEHFIEGKINYFQNLKSNNLGVSSS